MSFSYRAPVGIRNSRSMVRITVLRWSASATRACFNRTFHKMDITVDDPKVG
jgi:hypothetical protein